MNLAAIEQAVSDRVEPGAVVNRLLQLACVRHTKSASYSDCSCHYCWAIKRYVRAKIRFNRLDKQHDWYDRTVSSTEQARSHALTTLLLTAQVKECAKTICLDHLPQGT